MGVFLIVAAPAWYLLIVSLYPVPTRRWRGVALPFIGGLVIGMAALTVTLSLLTRTPYGDELGNLYRWAWLRGPGWATLISVAAICALFLPRPTSYSRIREITGWLSGMAFTYLLWQALSPTPGFDGFRVIYLPVLWISCMGLTAWLADRGLRLDGPVRWLLLAAALVFSSIITFLPVLYSSGERVIAWLVTVPLAALGGLLAYLDSRGRLA